MRKLTLLTLGLSGLLLVGCASKPVPTEQEPKITEDVKLLMASPDVVNGQPTATTLAALFNQYPGCEQRTKVWEEMEPGVIFFTCKVVRAGLIQFVWKKNEKGTFDLNKSVITNMADQEWSAMEFRGVQAQQLLDKVRRGEKILETPEKSPLPEPTHLQQRP